MSDKFRHCVFNLDFLNNLPTKARKKALEKLACDSCYYKAIKEIAKNIVKKKYKANKC